MKDLKVGDTGKVIGFEKSGKAYRKRLLAMGLTPGTEFSVTRFAPMGDPVEIKLRGFSLSLRKNEADVLLIEKL
jgi:ferrous iron transport protein A